MSIVRDRYVDALPLTKLVKGGIRGMVQSLDADSALLGPQQYPELGAMTATDGDVGVVLGRRNGGLAVIAARDGTPARTAGLRSGDYILNIDGVTTESMPPMDAAAHLRGRPGTKVALNVARTGWAEPKSLTLTRAKPPADRVSDQALGEGILYVRIPEFGDGTARELRQLLDVAPAERVAGLVLDLRNTPGGQVPAAAAVAGMFLDPGNVVARVQSRVPGLPRELLVSAAAGRHDQPMAVLVNHGTESAAEVLAGALQDWGRAAIVGSATFGDASAQSMIPLPGGQALSLTTVRYLTPKGRAISRKGIVPDVVATTPAPADLEPAATTANLGRADPEVELAFDLVKAARLLEHAPPPATASEQTGAAVRWWGDRGARAGLLRRGYYTRDT
jgi:carboxyl-terminal processing protease